MEKLGLRKKRRCIFCEAEKLTNEHIYPKWLSEFIKLEEITFKPSSTAILIQSTEMSDKIEDRKWFSENMEIKYDDFKAKLVCETCNTGWMSLLESQVKNIVGELLQGKSDIETNAQKAYALSKWAIIKVILISQTLQMKTEYDRFLLEMIANGIIPEGFMVEITDFDHYFLNFSIGNTITFQPERISKEQMELAADNFFIGCLQIGKIGLRVSFLKTSISVNRIQINKKLFLLHPFGATIPFLGIDLADEATDIDRDSEVIALANSLTICDRLY